MLLLSAALLKAFAALQELKSYFHSYKVFMDHLKKFMKLRHKLDHTPMNYATKNKSKGFLKTLKFYKHLSFGQSLEKRS